MLPKGFLVGRLVADPQSGSTQNGNSQYARFSVACNDVFVKANTPPTAHFFNCVAWGKRANFIQNFLKKGDKVFIEFTLSTNSYTNQEGRLIKVVDLVIENIESLGVKGSSNSGEDYNSGQKTSLDSKNDNSESLSSDDDNISIDDIYG